ncbi:MAG: hypothetical protein V4474_02775 [Patescibacteria group bacterium]
MAETAQAAEASTQAPADTTPIYEAAFHIVPTVGDGGVSAVVDKIKSYLAAPQNGESAEIIKEVAPQKMQLAYVIERAGEGKREKYSEAYFGSIKFATAERATAAALLESLHGTREVLRSLVISTTREEIKAPVARAVYTSDRLEGQTLKKPTSAPEKPAEVSQEELDKSIEALVAPESI